MSIPPVRVNSLEYYAVRSKHSPRVLLKLEEVDGKKQLVVKELNLSTLLDTIWNRKSYKLNTIISFLADEQFQPSTTNEKVACRLLESKAKKHNDKWFAKKINSVAINALASKSKVVPNSVPQPAAQNPEKTAPVTRIDPGKGIANPANNCFLNSSVQALRFTDSFRQELENKYKVAKENSDVSNYQSLVKKVNREHGVSRSASVYPEHLVSVDEFSFIGRYLTDPEAKKNLARDTVIVTLHQMYEKLDKGQEITADETQLLRALIFSFGYEEIDATMGSQEDARAISSKLLEIINYPIVSYMRSVEHDFDPSIRVASLTTRDDKGYVVPIQLGLASDNSQLSELVLDSAIMEPIDKEAILAQDEEFSETQVQTILASEKEIPTIQRLELLTGKIPNCLPISLIRYDNFGRRIPIKITPDDVLDIPVAGTDKSIRYRLKSVAVHHGANVRSGHYFSYIRREEGGKPIWVEYNDRTVKKHDKSNGVIDDITKNGYLFFYEKEGEVERKITPGQ